jgi:hypothetical protein
MKLIGVLFILFAWWSLSIMFTWSGLGWLLLGIFILTAQELLNFLTKTERFIHRRK